VSRRRKSKSKAQRRFDQAVLDAEWIASVRGLGAIKKSEGKKRVSVAQEIALLGSADIDGACRDVHPQANRWDYLVGVERSGEPVVHYVEVHSAETSEVSVLEKKLAWLRGEYLGRAAQEKLKTLTSEFHWVASGRVNIPKTTPQYRYLSVTLRSRGLQGPVTSLELC